jgi:hypothetical protein
MQPAKWTYTSLYIYCVTQVTRVRSRTRLLCKVNNATTLTPLARLTPLTRASEQPLM